VIRDCVNAHTQKIRKRIHIQWSGREIKALQRTCGSSVEIMLVLAFPTNECNPFCADRRNKAARETRFQSLQQLVFRKSAESQDERQTDWRAARVRHRRLCYEPPYAFKARYRTFSRSTGDACTSFLAILGFPAQRTTRCLSVWNSGGKGYTRKFARAASVVRDLPRDGQKNKHGGAE